jgi:DNA replication protein DnaC
MRWDEAIEIYKVPKMYQQADLGRCGKNMNPSDLVFIHEWLKSPEKASLYIYGGVGCGKTYLMTAIFREVIQSSLWCSYTTAYHMDMDLLMASKGNFMNDQGYPVSEKALLDRFQQVDVLFIDDLGTEKSTDRMTQQLGAIVDTRLSNLSPTIITSNLNPTKLSEAFGERTASRLKMYQKIAFLPLDLRQEPTKTKRGVTSPV